jgi:hypothetical protein
MNDVMFLMLIKVSAGVLANRAQLISWIDEIEDDYMERFGHFGASAAHLELTGAPWHFALVFPGSQESVTFLTNAIESKAPGQTDILTLEGTNLDDFRAGAQA